MARPKYENPKALAERLRAVAAAVGTQAEAAKRARVSLTQFQRYVAARAEPTIETLAKLSASTGFSLEWILTGTGPERDGEQLEGGLHPTPAQVQAALFSSRTASRMMYPDARFKEMTERIAAAREATVAITELYTGLVADGYKISPTAFLTVGGMVPMLLRDFGKTNVQFHSTADMSALVAEIVRWLLVLSATIKQESEWESIIAAAVKESLLAFLSAEDLADEIMRGPDQASLPDRLAIALGAREIVYRHLKHVERHNLVSLAKNERVSAPKVDK